MDSVDKPSQCGHNPPGNQDTGNPDASSDFVQQQITGDLKEEVAEKENSEDQSILLAGNSELFVHRQRCKPNVDAVEKANDVKEKNERDDPGLHFPNGLRLHRL